MSKRGSKVGAREQVSKGGTSREGLQGRDFKGGTSREGLQGRDFKGGTSREGLQGRYPAEENGQYIVHKQPTTLALENWYYK